MLHFDRFCLFDPDCLVIHLVNISKFNITGSDYRLEIRRVNEIDEFFTVRHD